MCEICEGTNLLMVIVPPSSEYVRADYCPRCGRKISSDGEDGQGDQVEIQVEPILDAVRDAYKAHGYSARFNRTATRKKILTALKNKEKGKKLYPLQIILAFKLYLYEESEKETEIQYVKQSETFMTNQVYDYASNPRVAKRVDKLMTDKYGEKWRSVKFKYA